MWTDSILVLQSLTEKGWDNSEVLAILVWVVNILCATRTLVLHKNWEDSETGDLVWVKDLLSLISLQPMGLGWFSELIICQ